MSEKKSVSSCVCKRLLKCTVAIGGGSVALKLHQVVHIEVLEFVFSDSGNGTWQLVYVLAVVESFSASVSVWKRCPLFK